MGVGGEISADIRVGIARYIGEASDTSDDGRRSAGALESELLDGGLTGVGLEAEWKMAFAVFRASRLTLHATSDTLPGDWRGREACRTGQGAHDDQSS